MYFKTLSPGYKLGAFDPATLKAYAIADIPFTVITSLIAAYGLWKMRKWSWVLTLIINGIYLHAMTVLISEALLKGNITVMFYVSIYFLVFSLFTAIYLIFKRNAFDIK